MSKVTFLKDSELLRNEIESQFPRCLEQKKMAEDQEIQELMCMEQADLMSKKLECLECNTELEKLKCLVEWENRLQELITEQEVMI